MRTNTIYHNTNGISGVALKVATAENICEKDIILRFLKVRPKNAFTGDQIHDSLIALKLLHPGKPLTNTRRALTDLMADGLVYKREATKISKFGRPAHLWQAVIQTNLNF